MFRQIHEKARIHLGYVTTKRHVSTSHRIDRGTQISSNHSCYLAHGRLVQGMYIAILRINLYSLFTTLKLGRMLSTFFNSLQYEESDI